MSRSKGPPKSTGATPQSWSCTCSRSQSVAVARASSSSQRAVLDLRSWRPRGGIRFPLGPSAQCPHNSPPPTSARPSPTLRASALCDESSLEPWACLDESRAFSLAQSQARNEPPASSPKSPNHASIQRSAIPHSSLRSLGSKAAVTSPPLHLPHPPVSTPGSGWSRRAPGALEAQP